MAKLKHDLTGKVFNGQKVIGRDLNNKKRCRWILECDCGSRHSVDGYELINRKTPKCKFCNPVIFSEKWLKSMINKEFSEKIILSYNINKEDIEQSELFVKNKSGITKKIKFKSLIDKKYIK